MALKVTEAEVNIKLNALFLCVCVCRRGISLEGGGVIIAFSAGISGLSHVISALMRQLQWAVM